MPPISPREKIAHLHRRLGFGATLADLEAGEKLGVEGTLQKLLKWEGSPSGVPMHPFELAFKPKEEAEPGGYRFRLWWVLQIVAGARPLQDKLALFWHSHFAVSEAKVEHGPAMLDYMLTLRRVAGEPFPVVLRAMAKNPALMRYLDLDRAIKGHPNENFAREVMELYTLGEGRGYTEKDVQEVSRALTGWGIMDLFWESGKTNDDRLKALLRDKRPSMAFVILPEMRDDTPKTILGKTKDWQPDEVLDLLALHPMTVERIVGKLWAYFAYADPDPKDLAPIIKVFNATKGDIRATVAAIAKSPAFWSERCIRGLVSSPADFVLGFARKQNLGPTLLAMRDKDAGPTTPCAKPLMDELWYLHYMMEREGFPLLYPQDVSGWKPDRGWVSTAAMAERMKFQGSVLWNDKGPREGFTNVQTQIRGLAPKTDAEVANALLAVLDAPDLPKIRAVATELVKQRGVDKVLTEKQPFAEVMYVTVKLLHASPESQLI